MAFSMPTVLAVTEEEVIEACGEGPSGACRWVLERTSNEQLATITEFLVARPLKILFICAGAWLLNRVVRRAIRRFVARLAGTTDSSRWRRARERAPSILFTQGTPSVRSASRAETIGQVLRSVSTVIIYGFAAVYVVAELGLQLGPLVAGAGIVGIALGFGAQSLVRDFLSGLFILVEDQYGVGDVIDWGEGSGTVEEVTLRVTRLRDVQGTVWHVPNGTIRRVGNKSQQWARAVLDIVVATETDLDRAQEVLSDVAVRVCGEEALQFDVLEAPEVWGVEHFGPEGVTLRLAVRTRPGGQWKVMRALRMAIAEAFVAEGIEMPAP